jgi:hypothetical protein
MQKTEDGVSELIDCQRVVERMLANGTTLAEVEEYIERCALDGLEKAGLWMLAWAHQDPATQLRLAKETLAIVTSMRTRERPGSTQLRDPDELIAS